MAFRVASQLGCTVEELNDRMTHAEFLQWCEYLTWDEKRITKNDVYLARITAMLAAQLNNKQRYTVQQFLLGDEDTRPGHKKLKDMEAGEIKSLFMSIPGAVYREGDNG